MTAAARAAVFVGLLAWFTASHASSVNFPLLPALKSDVAEQSLLLDIAQDGGRLLVGGEQGIILWSDDGGRTWTQADVPVSLAITSVAFSAPGYAWATAHDGFLLHSADNGETWAVKLAGTDVARLSVAASERKVEVLRSALADATEDSREDAEWALDDALFALEEANAAIEFGMTTPLLDVWFANDSAGYALGAYGVFLRTVDGGETWVANSDRLDNPDNYHLYAIAHSNDGTLLLAGEAGTLLRSLDQGDHWERIDTGYSGSFFGAVATGDGSLLIFGLRGNTFRSIDQGATWVTVDTGDQRTLMCGTTSADGTVILAGAAGALLQSRDAGASFELVPTSRNRMYSDVIRTADGSTLLVGFGGVSIIHSAGSDLTRASDD